MTIYIYNRAIKSVSGQSLVSNYIVSNGCSIDKLKYYYHNGSFDNIRDTQNIGIGYYCVIYNCVYCPQPIISVSHADFLYANFCNICNCQAQNNYGNSAYTGLSVDYYCSVNGHSNYGGTTYNRFDIYSLDLQQIFELNNGGSISFNIYIRNYDNHSLYKGNQCICITYDLYFGSCKFCSENLFYCCAVDSGYVPNYNYEKTFNICIVNDNGTYKLYVDNNHISNFTFIPMFYICNFYFCNNTYGCVNGNDQYSHSLISLCNFILYNGYLTKFYVPMLDLRCCYITNTFYLNKDGFVNYQWLKHNICMKGLFANILVEENDKCFYKLYDTLNYKDVSDSSCLFLHIPFIMPLPTCTVCANHSHLLNMYFNAKDCYFCNFCSTISGNLYYY